MAKWAAAGELNAKARFVSIKAGINENGFNTLEELDVFPKPCWVKWTWAHGWSRGSEVFDGRRLEQNQSATITMRYSAKINTRCKVYLLSDGGQADAFEVVSIDWVDEKRRYMEIKVKREIKA